MVRIIFLTFLFYCLTSFAQSVYQPTAQLLNIDGAIGPVAADYVERGIKKAKQQRASLIVLQLNTPGGLDKSMRAIVSQIISSPIPIVVYVAPSGARAASAGTFILYASHIAAMAPGTNIGAATPVSLTETQKESSVSEKKAASDASAYIRSLAQLRNRNAVWGEKAVLTGASLSATESLQMKVIDIVAVDFADLMAQVNNKKVVVNNKQIVINTNDLKITTFVPDWRSRFLAIITDPNIAYILLLIGIYGLIFEFMNPGFVLPGVVGAISLFVALYAFQLLPINYVGLILILMGIAFIIAEALVPSFGALGVGGVVAFVVGSVMLVDTDVGGFKLLLPIIIAVTLLTVGFLLFCMQLVLRAHRRPIVSGTEEMIGSTGVVLKKEGEKNRYRVRIRGELWQIESDYPLHPGQTVKVIAMDELVLKVIPEELEKNIKE